VRAFIQLNKIIFHFLLNIILKNFRLLTSIYLFMSKTQLVFWFIMHSIKNSLFW